MSVYNTDEEQVELLRQWWRKHGRFTIIVIVAVIVMSFGWRYWQQREVAIAQRASAVYEQLQNSITTGNQSALESQAAYLISEYPRTPYAKNAALLLAQQAVNDGKFDQALAKFAWVIEKSKQPAIRQVARIRSARILLAQKKPQAAFKILTKVDDDAYQASIDRVRGDIYLSQGKKQQAREAYTKALALLSPTDVTRPLLQMKLDELAGSSKKSAKKKRS